MAYRTDVFNPCGREYYSCSGCHCKNAAKAIGFIIGIPVCLMALEQAVGAFSKEFLLSIIIIPWSLIEIASVVSFLIGIYRHNSTAMTPFIWNVYLLICYFAIGFGLGVVFLARDDNIPPQVITRFILLNAVNPSNFIDASKIMVYYTVGMAVTLIILIWCLALLIQARYYVCDYENHTKNNRKRCNL